MLHILPPPKQAPQGFVASGFSVMEVLITLALMGLIAAFTIPPLFQGSSSRQERKFNAIAEETAHMVSNAYEQYRNTNPTVTTQVGIPELTPYMQFVRVDSTSIIDDMNTLTTSSCVAYRCLRLHNGAIMLYATSDSSHFGNTAPTNMIWYLLDPDGKQTDSTTNGPGKSAYTFLLYDGRIYTWGTVPTTVTTYYSVAETPYNYSAVPSRDPSWFTGF